MVKTNQTNKIKIVKAIGINLLYSGMDRTGFQILYDNNKTIDFDLCYLDRTENDFSGETQ